MTGEVPAADMRFSGEPTSDGDTAAEYMRAWYEAHRETDRDRKGKPWELGLADNFMIALMNEAGRIEAERERQRVERAKPETQLEALIRLRAAVIKAGGPQSRIDWIDKGIALERAQPIPERIGPPPNPTRICGLD